MNKMLFFAMLCLTTYNVSYAQTTDEIKEQAKINDKFSIMFNFSSNIKLPDSVKTILINYAKNKNLDIQTTLKQQYKLKMIYDVRNNKEDRLYLCDAFIKECNMHETYMPVFLIQDVKKFILSN